MAPRPAVRKETSGITVLFEKSEKLMIRRAAIETDVRSASEFIRQAAIKAAQKATKKVA
jgi:uncharacterized protein (DUF1778 family)